MLRPHPRRTLGARHRRRPDMPFSSGLRLEAIKTRSAPQEGEGLPPSSRAPDDALARAGSSAAASVMGPSALRSVGDDIAAQGQVARRNAVRRMRPRSRSRPPLLRDRLDGYAAFGPDHGGLAFRHRNRRRRGTTTVSSGTTCWLYRQLALFVTHTATSPLISEGRRASSRTARTPLREHHTTRA